MVDVAQWAEIRRMHRVERLPIDQMSKHGAAPHDDLSGVGGRAAAEVRAGVGEVEA